MTTDDILQWVAIENVEIMESLTSARRDNDRDIIFGLIGALEALEKLRMHILMKTNPHNREDIKKFNEKNQ